MRIGLKRLAILLLLCLLLAGCEGRDEAVLPFEEFCGRWDYSDNGGYYLIEKNGLWQSLSGEDAVLQQGDGVVRTGEALTLSRDGTVCGRLEILDADRLCDSGGAVLTRHTGETVETEQADVAAWLGDWACAAQPGCIWRFEPNGTFIILDEQGQSTASGTYVIDGNTALLAVEGEKSPLRAELRPEGGLLLETDEGLALVRPANLPHDVETDTLDDGRTIYRDFTLGIYARLSGELGVVPGLLPDALVVADADGNAVTARDVTQAYAFRTGSESAFLYQLVEQFAAQDAQQLYGEAEPPKRVSFFWMTSEDADALASACAVFEGENTSVRLYALLRTSSFPNDGGTACLLKLYFTDPVRADVLERLAAAEIGATRKRKEN